LISSSSYLLRSWASHLRVAYGRCFGGLKTTDNGLLGSSFASL